MKWIASCLLVLTLTSYAWAENWPAWRGPTGDGVTTETGLPLEWSHEKNIVWRTPLPARGNSTPVVWGDQILLSQALERESRRTLMCFDRKTGKELWQVGVTREEKDPTHQTNPYNSASPVTDGERVIVWYGAAGVYCYDMAGGLQWHRELGEIGHEWGNGSSPVLTDEHCILNFGPGKPSFLIALDKRTGETAWQIDVPHERSPDAGPSGLGDSGTADDPILFGSWSTPLVHETDGRQELIVTIPGKVLSLDPATGTENWSSGGLAELAYASPIVGDGIVVALGGFFGPSVAVRTGGEGDVTESHRAWHWPRSKSLLPSGVVHEGHMYLADMKGIAMCVDLETGKTVWEKRLGGSGGKNDTWSSMVLSGDRIYLPNQSGDTFVFRASPKFEQLARNELGETTNSSIAVSDGQLFIRTHEALWCVGEGE